MNSVNLNGNINPWQQILSRNRWVLGVWLLLGALLLWYSTLIPVFGEFQVTSITKNSLPLVYLAIGQAIIVIGGGIDLSVGSLLLLGNVIAARFMEDQSSGTVFVIGFGMIIGIGILNGITGYVISVSKIPDECKEEAKTFRDKCAKHLKKHGDGSMNAAGTNKAM